MTHHPIEASGVTEAMIADLSELHDRIERGAFYLDVDEDRRLSGVLRAAIVAMQSASPPPVTASAEEVDDLTTALLALARHGIPADVQELLVAGDPSQGVPPGALRAAISSLGREKVSEGVEKLREVAATLRDYVADAAAGTLTYEGSGEGFVAMAKEDLARLDAALKEGASR